MDCPLTIDLATATQFPKVDARLERARELEFYRYYEPFYSTSANGATQQRTSDNVVHLAPDSALTAFAQLGVIRLQARRSFVTFFDRTTQYVFAEATRSLSLQTGAVDDHLDALLRGSVALPRSSTYCEHVAGATIHLQPSDLADGPPVTVIPDLTESPLFRHTVAHFPQPQPRFYCGVPIMSPEGFAIGVYCVLDDTPRAGLEPWQITMLKDMSATVMSHLEMARAKTENARSRRMIRGLANISRNNPTFNSASYNHRVTEKLPIGKAAQEPEVPCSVQCSTTSPENNDEPASDNGEGSDARVSVKPSSQPSPATDTPGNPASDDVNKIFSRAAETLNTVMEVSGVMFLDASISSFGGLVDASSQRNRNEASTAHSKPMSRPLASRNYSTDSIASSASDQKDASVLGFSSCSASYQSTKPGQSHPFAIRERFLQTLLKQYPNGKIWELHDDRNLHDQDIDPASPGVDNTLRPETSTSMDSVQTGNESSQINRQGRRATERRTLRTLFPQAHHLAFSGLWDNQRQRWFAACFTWSFDPVRTFNHDFELPFLSTVGESVMTAIARLDVNTVTKAQNNLLSSLSHELRSPLHGMLGCTECLRETAVNAFQESLISTAETCCKTLLGTMDHLLQYARINDLTKQNADLHDARHTVEDSPTSQLDVLRSNMSSYETDVDLSFLVEEVVETAFAGYDYVHIIRRHDHEDQIKDEPTASIAHNAASLLGRSLQTSEKESIVIVLDIERQPDFQWTFRTQAGAWRRVLLNLATNSLKFTTSGFVKISLKAVPSESLDATSYAVVLTVTDSGRGIGTTFLRESLFAPFSKEESSSPGTGLGLRLVHDVIAKMGGLVQVQSAPSQGTEVNISVPHLFKSGIGRLNHEQSELRDRSQRTDGLKVNFFGPLQATNPSSVSRDPANSWSLFQESFKKLCLDWFGMKASFSVQPEPADIYITTADIARAASDDASGEEVHLRDDNQAIQIGDKPLLVLCDSASSARALSQRRTSSHMNQCTEYISQPCGPRKLIKAFISCIDRKEASRYTTDSRRPSAGSRAPSRKQTPSEQFEWSHARPRSQDSPKPDRSGMGHGVPDPSSPSSPVVDKKPIDPIADTKSQIPIPDPSTLQPAKPVRTGEPRSPFVIDKEPDNAHATGPAKITVLLVDDNPVNLSILTLYMKKHGHLFKTATNGYEACQVYQHTYTENSSIGAKDSNHQAQSGTSRSLFSTEGTKPPGSSKNNKIQAFDFVFMDITMPVMDGLEATRQIRAFERKIGMRPANIIALTALASAAAQQEAFGSGVDRFCTKPVSMKQLTEIMKSDGRSRRENSTTAV